MPVSLFSPGRPEADSTENQLVPRPRWRRIKLAGTPRSFEIAVEPPGKGQDPISRELCSCGTLRSPNARLMLACLRPGQRVLDLGAHLGTLSLTAAAAGCEVLSLEASPRNAALLEASACRNGFDALRVVHAAASDRCGEVVFRQNGPFGQLQSGEAGPADVRVRATTVSDLLRSVGWDRVDFIKMDIEGAELLALAGMGDLLDRDDAPPLLYEGNGWCLSHFGSTVRELKGALAARGYRITWSSRSDCTRWRQATCKSTACATTWRSKGRCRSCRAGRSPRP
jgi:FkbM family methyltransferase